MNAPSFSQLSRQFNAVTWERTMAEIAEGGHDEMPPLRLDSTDVSDLKAYIDRLR